MYYIIITIKRKIFKIVVQNDIICEKSTYFFNSNKVLTSQFPIKIVPYKPIM